MELHEWRAEQAPTWTAQIYVAGNKARIEDICRKYCMDMGLCVTIEKLEFIYTGGAEGGVRIGLINYPRFSKPVADLEIRAESLGKLIAVDQSQISFSIVFPNRTAYFYRGDKGGPKP